MPKEYTLIGGNGTVVSPLEVTEDGDYFAGDSRAFNPVKVRAGGGGSSTLSGLTDVNISNPTDGQTLVYNATTGKWENGAGGGGDDIFETFGTISAATVTMTYDSERGAWEGVIVTDIGEEANSAVRNFRVTLDGTDYAFAPFNTDGSFVAVGEAAQLFASILPDSDPVQIMIGYMNESLHEPTITNVSGEYYCASDELAVLLNSGNPK